MIEKVQNFKILTNGSEITFVSDTSDKQIYLNDIVSITLDEKQYYFKVIKIDHWLKSLVDITAKQVGYYNKANRSNYTLFLDKEVVLVTDEEIIKRIEQESCYL